MMLYNSLRSAHCHNRQSGYSFSLNLTEYNIYGRNVAKFRRDAVVIGLLTSI